MFQAARAQCNRENQHAVAAAMVDGDMWQLQTLEQVWAVVEKDLEKNLLIFLEKLFLLEPCSVGFNLYSLPMIPASSLLLPVPESHCAQVTPLRELERRRSSDSELAEGPSLSERVKIVAKHFGLAVRAGVDGKARLPACPLARGFRSLARAIAAHGWGRDFLTSMGSAVALALASIFSERWMSDLARSWW